MPSPSRLRGVLLAESAVVEGCLFFGVFPNISDSVLLEDRGVVAFDVANSALLDDCLLNGVPFDVTDSSLFDDGCLLGFFAVPLLSMPFSDGEGLKEGEVQNDPAPPQVELVRPLVEELDAAAVMLDTGDLTLRCGLALGSRGDFD